MFTAPRFVAIDDDANHLQAIVTTFSKLGSPCFGVQYQADGELDPAHFKGVRVLFLDLHLLGGPGGSDNKKDYALLASILERIISRDGGPFIVVMWSQHAQLRDEFEAYLQENLDPNKGHCRPLAIISLPKEQYIDVTSGKVQQSQDLQNAIQTAVTNNAQLAALVSWETDVLAAATLTLSSLLNLIPANKQSTEERSQALDGILSLLAQQSVGRANVAADPRSAIAGVLAPILADRIQNQAIPEGMQGIWGRAITRLNDPNLLLTPEDTARMNRMLHLSAPEGEAIRATDWGAVLLLPASWQTDQEMSIRFGARFNEILNNEFRIERPDRGRCRVVLIRIGAVCDHAQGRRGPIPYTLGVEIPVDVQRPRDRLPDAEWRSPTIIVRENGAPVILAANSRFIISLSSQAVQDLEVQYRIREQLLMQLIGHTSAYISRPGIIEMRSS